MATNAISLSRIQPDFEYILAQLQKAAQSRATWTSFLTTDVGETLLEYISAVGELDQYAIARTFEEMFSETADIDSSLYAITKMLGVRLKRKSPAETYVRLPNAFNSDDSNTGSSANDEIIWNSVNNPYYDASIPLGGGSTPNATRITNAVKFYAYGKIKRIVSAEFASDVPMLILPYSRFTTSEGMLFNRLPIKFDAISDISNPNDRGWFGYCENEIDPSVKDPAILYRGDVNNKFFSPTGLDNYSIISTESNFTVSDLDVDVFVNQQKLNISYTGLWNYRSSGDSSNTVADFTTSKGKLQILFGTSFYGYKPTVNDTVQLRYIITQGLADNKLRFKSTKIACLEYKLDNTNDALIYPLINGEDEIKAKDYSLLGPFLFASANGEKGVTAQDYKTIFTVYPGNLDAVVDGQRKLNPDNPAWMNLLRVVTYPKYNMTYYNQMFTEIKQKTMISNEFYTEWDYTDMGNIIPIYPIQRLFNIRANVFCTNLVDLVAGRAAIETALLKLVDKYSSPVVGKLNVDIPREIILKTIREAVDGIDYIELIEPSATVSASMTPPQPSTIADAGGSAGSLTGSVDYAVEVLCEDNNQPVSSTVRSWGLGSFKNFVGSGQTIRVYFEKVPNFTCTVPDPITVGIVNYPYLKTVSYRLWRRRNSLPNPVWEPVSATPVSESSLTTAPATNLTYITDAGTTGLTPVPAYPTYNAAQPSIALLSDNWLSVNTINMTYSSQV